MDRTIWEIYVLNTSSYFWLSSTIKRISNLYSRLSQWLCQANKPCSKDVIKEYQIIYLCKNKKWHTQWWQNIFLLPLRMVCLCNLLFSFPSGWKTIMLVFSLLFLKAREHYTHTHTHLYTLLCRKRYWIYPFSLHIIRYQQSQGPLYKYVYICLINELIFIKISWITNVLQTW